MRAGESFMDIKEENRLSELAKEIKEIDKRITRAIAEGEDTYKLKQEFEELRDEIKEILGDSLPIHHRDPYVRKILKKVTEGDYFYVDKEERNFLNLLKNASPERLENIYRLLGIDKGQISESNHHELFLKFDEEIHSSLRITSADYFERKNNFSTIIVANPLPPKFLDYFKEIRACFLFDYLYAATGLCRILIELSFRDKYNELGFSKKRQPHNVYNINDPKINEMINEVCNRPELKSLKHEAKKLYYSACPILHGKESTIKLNETEVLQFIRRVFKLVEALYS
jgi:hypothetical protein